MTTDSSKKTRSRTSSSGGESKAQKKSSTRSRSRSSHSSANKRTAGSGGSGRLRDCEQVSLLGSGGQMWILNAVVSASGALFATVEKKSPKPGQEPERYYFSLPPGTPWVLDPTTPTSFFSNTEADPSTATNPSDSCSTQTARRRVSDNDEGPTFFGTRSHQWLLAPANRWVGWLKAWGMRTPG